MLLRTEIKRRTESLQTYISSIEQKINDKKYREALAHLQKNRNSVYNSYLAPYDPNVYYLDSLKGRQEKLYLQINRHEDLIRRKKQQIEKIKMKRGYQSSVSSEQNNCSPKKEKQWNKNRKYQLNLQQIQEIKENEELIHKLDAPYVNIYATRFKLTLDDIDQIDFQPVTLISNFRVIRILAQFDEDGSINSTTSQISLDTIITYDQCLQHILISWMSPTYSENYMIIRFNDDKTKEEWYQMILLCKIIQQARAKKTKIFQPVESPVGSPQKRQEEDLNILQTDSEANEIKVKPPPQEVHHSRIVNPNSSWMFLTVPNQQRSRRQSELFPINKRSEAFPDRKFRKVSEDLTRLQLNGSYLNEKKLNPFKSQKSFDDDASQSNSFKTKQEQNSYEKNSFMKKGYHDQKIMSIHENSVIAPKNDSNHFFMNSSIINWIEEEHEDDKSSFRSKEGLKFNNESEKDLNVFQGDKNSKKNTSEKLNESERISEESGEVDESPMLPQNMRSKSGKSENMGFQLYPVIVGEKEKKDQKIQEYEYNQQKTEEEEDEEEVQLQDNSKKDNSISLEQQIEHQKEESEEPKEENEEPEKTESDQEEGQIEGDGEQGQVSQNDAETSQKYDLDLLSKGVKVWKCSIDGWNAHKKILSLSKNYKQLNWKDEKSQEVKKVLLYEIEQVNYGIVDAGITKHIKKNLESKRCLTIKVHVDKKKDKTLQFYLQESEDPEDFKNFAINLREYVEYRKGI